MSAMSSREPAVLVERETLLKQLAGLLAKVDAIDQMEKALSSSLNEVRAQADYYANLEREIKTEVHPTGVSKMMHGMKGG